MLTFTKTLLASALLASPAFAQSQELFRIEKPAGAGPVWGGILAPLGDQDGDGVRDLMISGTSHGGGHVGSVHSGANGDLLFHLSVPFAAMFYGDGILPIADRDGDGIPDIVVLGSRSGASQSFEGELRFHSGADGSTLQVFRLPVGLNFVSHGEWSVQNLGDMDGDGIEDLLCRTNGTTTGGPTYSLFSGADGHVIYHLANSAGRILFEGVARLADQDGDGLGDFALAARVNWVDPRLIVFSSATGQVIVDSPAPGLVVLTGNHEPFITLRDEANKPAQHVAYGGVFSGALGRLSVADGSTSWSSTCDFNTEICYGSRLMDVGDLNDDGHSDLIALEADAFNPGGLGMRALDGRSGAVLSEEHVEGMSGGYSGATRLLAMPGVDPQGFPAFALFEGLLARVSVRRMVPEIGTPGCVSKPNSTGVGALIRAHGSSSRSAGHFELSLERAPIGAFAIFVYGDQNARLPFGEGVLCIGGQTGRLAIGRVDASGEMQQSVDLSTYAASQTGWTFQAIFRDTTTFGLNSSDSLTVKLQ